MNGDGKDLPFPGGQDSFQFRFTPKGRHHVEAKTCQGFKDFTTGERPKSW